MAAKIYLRYDADSLGIKQLEYAQIVQLAASLHRDESALFLGRFAFLASSDCDWLELQGAFMRTCIDPCITQVAAANRRLEQPGVIISKSSALYALALICSFAENDNAKLNPLQSAYGRHAIGNLVIQVSGLIYALTDNGESVETEQLLELHPIEKPNQILFSFLQSRLAEATSDPNLSMVRCSKIWYEFLPEVARLHGSSLAPFLVQFQQKYNTDVDDVVLLAFSVFLTTYKYDHTSINQPAGILRSEFFKNFKWTDERIDASLAFLAVDVSEVWKANLVNPITGYHVPTFERYPMLRRDDQVSIVNVESLLRLMSWQLLNTISDCLHGSERDRFRGWIGEAFERYCVWLLEGAFDLLPRYDRPRIMLPTKQGDIDILVIKGKVGIFIEVKADSIDTATLFGPSAERYANSVKSSKSYREAPVQLAKAISRHARSEHALARYIPVIVVPDEAFGQFCIQHAYQQRFKASLDKELKQNDELSFLCARVIVLTMRDLEEVSLRVASGHGIVDLLDGVIAHDRVGEYPAAMSISERAKATFLSTNHRYINDAKDRLVSMVRQTISGSETAT